MIKHLCKQFLYLLVLFSATDAMAWSYTSKDFKEEMLSPIYSRPANQVFLYGSLLSLSLKYFGKKEIIYPFQESISKKNRLGDWNDRIEIMGRWVPNLLYAGGMGLKYYLSKDKNGKGDRDEKPLEKSLAMMRATLYASTLTVILKYTVRQPRPGGGQKTSFPSGHTTTAFAFASVVGSFHEWYYAIPAYTIATAVAFQRLTNNNHYLHDVIAGATIGIAYGLGVSKAVKNKNSFMDNMTILPISSDGMMMAYSYRF